MYSYHPFTITFKWSQKEDFQMHNIIQPYFPVSGLTFITHFLLFAPRGWHVFPSSSWDNLLRHLRVCEDITLNMGAQRVKIMISFYFIHCAFQLSNHWSSMFLSTGHMLSPCTKTTVILEQQKEQPYLSRWLQPTKGNVSEVWNQI